MMLNFKAVRIDAPAKRVCFWGAPSQIESEKDWRANLSRTGSNTGNLFIGNGLFNNLNCTTKAYGLNFETTDPTTLHERYDHLFIPASNFLNPFSDFGPAHEFLAETRIPFFCFGLGSQHLPGTELVLKPGTEKFIRLLAERSGTVGVRGVFTADLMNTMGLKNVSVVGCPSLLNMSPAAANRLQADKPSLAKIAVHFSNNVRSHAVNASALRDTENALLARALSENAYYILQNEIEEFQFLAAATEGDEASATRSLGALAKTFGIDLSNPAFASFMRHRIRAFFAVPEWIGAMSTMTAAIGSRFHGTISALLAGTPGLLLAHDMRTREMAEFFQVPVLPIDRSYTQEELIENLLALDMTSFVSRVSEIQIEWKYFARANGLDLVEAETSLPVSETA
jgi:hypothetical protein